ncbi:hypothetical protein Btru_054503 [Bulinus truncatus]|nr:hypothetical protein Btru_054503 [Bulinus truncatus]
MVSHLYVDTGCGSMVSHLYVDTGCGSMVSHLYVDTGYGSIDHLYVDTGCGSMVSHQYVDTGFGSMVSHQYVDTGFGAMFSHFYVDTGCGSMVSLYYVDTGCGPMVSHPYVDTGCGPMVSHQYVDTGCGSMVSHLYVDTGCGSMVSHLYVDTGCGSMVSHLYVDTGCGSMVSHLYVDTGCGSMVSHLYVDTGCGSMVDHQFVDTGCGSMVSHPYVDTGCGSMVITSMLTQDVVQCHQYVDTGFGAMFEEVTSMLIQDVVQWSVSTMLTQDVVQWSVIPMLIQDAVNGQSPLCRNPAPEFESSKPGSLLNEKLQDGAKFSRSRRQSASTYYVDVTAFLDYSCYSRFMEAADYDESEALSRVQEYYAFIFSGIDLIYQNFQASNIRLRVNLNKVLIFKSTNAFKLYYLYSNLYGITTYVGTEAVLSYFTIFLNSTDGRDFSFPYDHAMLFVGRFKERLKKSIILGLAWVKTLCRTDGASASVIEDMGDYSAIITGAHELGHSLAANHDGENNTCLYKDRYLMASSDSVPTYSNKMNPWRFSSCSIDSIVSYVKSLTDTARGQTCLSDALTVVGEFPDVSDRLLGQEFPSDEQCQFKYGFSSYDCKIQNSNKELCFIYCKKPLSSYCYGQEALSGTSCGCGKFHKGVYIHRTIGWFLLHLNITSTDVSNNALPNDINVTFQTDTNTSTELSLKRVDHITSNVPIYTIDTDEEGVKIKKGDVQGNENVAFYQDTRNDAVIQVFRQNGTDNHNDDFKIMRGEYQQGNVRYSILPVVRSKRQTSQDGDQSDLTSEIYDIRKIETPRETRRDYLTAPPEFESSKPGSLLNEKLQDGAKFSRSRRQSSSTYYVDVTAFLDYSCYRRFLEAAGYDETNEQRNDDPSIIRWTPKAKSLYTGTTVKGNKLPTNFNQG